MGTARSSHKTRIRAGSRVIALGKGGSARASVVTCSPAPAQGERIQIKGGISGGKEWRETPDNL